jgi:propanol-preferring alcohol dehydrogenase
MPAVPSVPEQYRAMVLARPGARRLEPREVAPPPLGPRQLRLRVHACGVCRSDLHVVDGELPDVQAPRIPGHEIVGSVVERGPGSTRFALGERVGVPWLAGTCGHCGYCGSGRENLCAQAHFTGYTVDGGYAEYAVADEAYAFALPPNYDDDRAAPLLCAGLIGHRALGMAGGARTLGVYGFGAAGHLVAQIALQQGRRVFAFTRPGDREAQALARDLGVHWAGDSDEAPPEPMDGAILFAPVGALVPQSLRHVAPGGTVVCAGIHMTDIPSFPYRALWMERSIRSVANLTRADGDAFFRWAAAHPLRLATTPYPLARANDALDDLRAGRLTGAAVLRC